MNKGIALTALGIGVLITGGWLWQLTRDKPIEVKLARVTRADVLETVSNTRAGTVNTCNRARISPMLSGQINSLAVQPGDRVTKGQILMELWNEDASAQLKLTRMEKRTAESRAAEVCTSADVARREATRFRELLRQKMVSDEQADLVIGRAGAETAACKAMHNMIDVSDAQISLAMANLERTIVRAPFNGIVAEVNGEVGEIVTPSPVGVATRPAIDLMDDSCTYVSVPIDEVDASKIRTGMTTRISLDAFPERLFSGTVSRVAPYVLDLEKQSRTVEIEVEFMEEAKALMPGYSADVEVILDTRSDTLSIPTQALMIGNEIMRINSEGTLEQQPVVTGLSNWEVTEVMEGLKEGDEVVLTVDREGVIAGASAVSAHN